VPTIREQIHNNAVALISLVVAVGALGYNTWRNETTEEQRNVRHAAFRVLEDLGELQEVIDARHYYLPFEEGVGSEGELRLRGFGSVAMIRDLTSVMPPPAPQKGIELHELWLAHFLELAELDQQGRHSSAAKQAEQALTEAINGTRFAVISVLKQLD
jgi:hypothetical protein